jgi:hypothetical protein
MHRLANAIVPLGQIAALRRPVRATPAGMTPPERARVLAAPASARMDWAAPGALVSARMEWAARVALALVRMEWASAPAARALVRMA